MKFLSASSRLAMALCALALAACGGGGANLSLAGSVYGNPKAGVVLVNKNTDEKITLVAGQTTFVFTKLLANDEAFDVEVDSVPSGVTCTPKNNKGHTGAFSITSVEIWCVTQTHKLGGTVSGSADAVNGLVIVNGADKLAFTAPGAFTMPAQVADGSPYGLAVLTQPAGHTCTIANGIGTMGAVDISNVQITCQ